MIRSADYKFSFAGKPIAEIGCPHAHWPWVLSFCNSFLCGHAEQALRELTIMPMDNGIACESVDADTGECTTGSAFATCAGFLCHVLPTAAKMGLRPCSAKQYERDSYLQKAQVTISAVFVDKWVRFTYSRHRSSNASGVRAL